MSVYKPVFGPAWRAMSGLYEDLQLISDRLDALWDMYDTTLAVEVRRDVRVDPVVEAPPSSLWPLHLPDKLRSIPSIPDLHIRADSRHRYVNRQVGHQTDMAGVGASVDLALPEGLSFWQPNDIARGLLPLARHDLDSLFSTELSRAASSRVPANDDDAMHGQYTLFDRCGQPAVLYRDVLSMIQPVYSGLARLCEEYAWMASQMYGMSVHAFRRSARMTIARVRPGFGLPLGLVPFERFNQGPVLTVCVGEPTSTWDMLPALVPETVPVRFSYPEGTLHVLDAHARLLYAFGEPQGSSPEFPRYRLTFYLGMEEARVRDPVTALGASVLGTPMVRANLVAGREHPDWARHQKTLTSAVEQAVYGLHARLLAFESRAAVRWHMLTFITAHQRPPTSGENWSSSMHLE